MPAPVDPLTAWSTVRETPRTLLARTVGVAAIPSVAEYAFASPNTGADAQAARQSATRIASHVPVDQPHLAFVNSTAQAAFATLDRVAQVATYAPSVAYPNNGFGQALQMVAGAISRGIGTSIYWVQTGGYDTHAGQNTNVANGSYNNLMTTLNGGLFAFYRDMLNQGLLSDTLVIQFSEFGRRISENGSNGTDHGAASMMMAMGGSVRGGIYGTAPDLIPTATRRSRTATRTSATKPTSDRSTRGSSTTGWAATRRRFSAGTSGTGRTSSEFAARFTGSRLRFEVLANANSELMHSEPLNRSNPFTIQSPKIPRNACSISG